MEKIADNLISILGEWVDGKQPLDRDWQLLASWELGDPKRLLALGIDSDYMVDFIRDRSSLFVRLIPDLPQIPLYSDQNFLFNLWYFWLPLAIKLSTKRRCLNRSLIQGILGGQGTGKSTLAKILSLILAKLGYRAIGLSLDDLYKTYGDRKLLQQVDPRLIWRGPPGTHDLDLGINILDQIKEFTSLNHGVINIPRFDKSAYGGMGDRTTPEVINHIDILLFEGWFVGVKPIDDSNFNNPPPPINTEEDRQFARDMNRKLADYLPLWDRLDGLIVLALEDYHLSKKWRGEAEKELIATGKSGMTAQEIDQFVEYFWKAIHPELFMTSLISDPLVDLVIKINLDRTLS